MIPYTTVDAPTDSGRVYPEKSSDLKPNEYGDIDAYLSTNKLKETERRQNGNDRLFSDSVPFREELSLTHSVVGKRKTIRFICVGTFHSIVIMASPGHLETFSFFQISHYATTCT